MEDNVAKLLQIIGGILIGVILLSLISFFFSSIGLWPAEEDQVESTEQLAKFNLEYEIYEKNGMYGVDVISCLNKAKSNNEKYAEGGSFLIGSEYGSNFYIDVWVRLKDRTDNYLEESLTVYHFNDRGVEEPYYGSSEKIQLEDGSTLTLTKAGFDISKNLYTHFTRDNQDVYTVWPDSFNLKFDDASDLRPDGGTHTFEENKYYSLLDRPESGSENNLVKLINLSNKSDSGSLDRIVTNTTGKNLYKWSKIIWKTSLSDFKKRKFKCDFIGYSSKTGRVNEIYFSEI